MYSLILFIIKFIPMSKKLQLADMLIDEVVKSTDYSINNTIAERIVVNVIKSTGNRVSSFIVKD